ncbi:MAG: hypothetical protein IPK19_36755 [Chloroflexi bacterium]|nr:hypothetical protein [Chloroflexota bacterium]
MRVRLSMFGSPAIAADNALVRFENRKAVALLAYLAATGAAQSRDKLAALLWPETDQALAALRTTLWEIRKKLGEDCLLVTRQDIALDAHGDVWADVDRFGELIRQSAAPVLPPQKQITLLQEAVDLYQDDFLAGFSLRDSQDFDDWQRDQMRYYQRLQARALLDLSELYQTAGDLNATVFTIERLRMLDRLAEEPIDRLMQLHLSTGQRQQAIRLFNEYAAQLEAELGVAPSESLIALNESALKSSATSTQTMRAVRAMGENLAVGSVTATIFRDPDTVTGRPRRLIGRDALLAQVVALLEEGERVLLVGMGGIGKTSTAAASASAYIASTRRPVLWLETAFQNAGEIFVALARAFDRQQAAQSAADPAGVVRELLAQHGGLLVLDNCWNAAALFEVLRAVPFSMPVLLTSRLRFPIEGEVIDLTVLNHQDSRSLIAYHARRDLPDDADLSGLMRLIGYHPYALEISGKQLKAQPGLTVRDLAARYARGTREIAVPGGYGESGRESIAQVIAVSAETLSEDSRSILAQMGALAAPRASRELLTLMLEGDLDAPLAALEQASLIAVEATETGSTYRMHGLIHSYTRELIRDSEDAHRRLIAGVSAYMGRHSRQPMRIEAEYSNILGAVRVARLLGDHEAAISIVLAIMVDGYFDSRGYTPDLLEHLDAAIRLAENAGRSVENALHLLLSKRANLMQMQGNLDAAFADNIRALATAPDMYRRALLATTLATISYRLKQDEYALYLNEAETVAREHEFHDIMCRITEIHGLLAMNQRRQAQRAAVARTSRIARRSPEPARSSLPHALQPCLY